MNDDEDVMEIAAILWSPLLMCFLVVALPFWLGYAFVRGTWLWIKEFTSR